MKSGKDGAQSAKITYGMGGLVCAAGTTLLPLLLPLCRAVGLSTAALGVACGLSCLSVALVPLFYALINGNTLIATGRYHIPFVVSSLLVALCAVGITCVGKLHAAAQALVLFGLFFLLALAMQIFAYTYFSIGKRLAQGGSAFAYSKLFAYLSPLLGALATLWLFDFDRVSIRAVVCLAGLIVLVGLVGAYMATCNRMALFLRVEPHHKRTLGENYKRFFAPLSNPRARWRFAAVLLTVAGVALAACAFPQLVFAARLGYTKGLKPTALIGTACIALVGGISSFWRGTERGAARTALILCILAAVATLVVVVLRFFAVRKIVSPIVGYIYAAVVGLALGGALPCVGKQSGLAAQETGVSSGRVYTLFNCAVTVGLALGTALSGTFAYWAGRHARWATATALVAFAVLLLAGTVLCFVLSKLAPLERQDEKENG